MKNPSRKHDKMELLLPAGSREALMAAVEGGADAVYLGLEQFNARQRARNFSQADWPVIVQYAALRGVRIYLTLNTLLKNREIPILMSFLPLLRQYPPAAIIVQDWGVFRLLKSVGFTQLHASTQMGFHNSQGSEFARHCGFTRLILARELTLQELREVSRKSKIELEVFVHGALCYSFSGGCLFSSLLGGMSANRGQCKQPCRRLYKTSSGDSYLFNLKDLQLLELIPELQRLGIRSIKVEGRLKRAEYVHRVARAYRMVMDDPGRLREAQSLLEWDFGRSKTHYFYGNSLQDSRNDVPYTGRIIGYVTSKQEDTLTLTLNDLLKAGDQIRILSADGTDRPGFIAAITAPDGKTLDTGLPGETVHIKHQDDLIQGGEPVLLTDRSEWKPQCEIPYGKPLVKRPPDSKWLQIVKELQKPVKVRIPSGLIIRLSEGQSLPQTREAAINEFLLPLPLTGSAVPEFPPTEYLIRLELPRFIPEREVDAYQRKITLCIEAGYRAFSISHLSQLEFFRQFQGLDIMANEWVYALNDLAIRQIVDAGVSGYIYPLENDIPNLFAYRNKNGIIPLFFTPELFYSRVPISVKSFEDTERHYHVEVKDGWTIVRSDIPVSLLHLRGKMEERGFSRFLMDMSGCDQGKYSLDHVIEAFRKQDKLPDTTQFNMKKGLW